MTLEEFKEQYLAGIISLRDALKLAYELGYQDGFDAGVDVTPEDFYSDNE